LPLPPILPFPAHPTTTARMSTHSTLRAARPALAAFAAMGVGWGAFAAVLPDLKAMLDVTEAELGRLMFMAPIAAVLAMLTAPAVGAAMGRYAMFGATILMALAFALPGQAASVWVFPIALMACGAATGLTDVLMNARVTEMERDRDQPLMNLCHAAYSFGLGGGAILTGFMRQADWPPGWVTGGMAAVTCVLALLTYEDDGTIHGLRRPRDRATAGLGLIPVIGGGIILIAFMTENAAENWSALHIEKTLGGSPVVGSLGPAVLAITMGTARLIGQGVAHRVAPRWLLTGGAVVSATGALIVAGAVSPAMAYAGFIVMGCGSALIAPTAFSLVGTMSRPEARARAVARATLLGYFGYFFGPPILGFIAGSLGLRMAFVFAAAMLIIVPVLARAMARQTHPMP
jgi:MFS family permease